METHPVPRVIFAERLDSGVVVTFEDGRCALYSASLLRETLNQARDLTDLPADDFE